jgi:thioredoxin-related protein
MMKALTVCFAALTAIAFAAAPEGWSTDLEKAFAQAKKENKNVIVEFTGSDFCPPCIMMRKNVFSKKEFVDAASKKFILVELDFPKSDEALAKKNEPYFEKYKVEGLPTVILFDSKGKEFLKHLDESLEKKDLD